MSGRHEPRLRARPSFVERPAFDERNSVLFLILGLVAVAEKVLSVVPELVETPPQEDAGPAGADQPTHLLR